MIIVGGGFVKLFVDTVAMLIPSCDIIPIRVACHTHRQSLSKQGRTTYPSNAAIFGSMIYIGVESFTELPSPGIIQSATGVFSGAPHYKQFFSVVVLSM